MIVDKIYTYLTEKEKTVDEAIRYEVEKLAGAIFKRQFMTDEAKDSKGVIRLSSCGKCPRQQAYAYHGIEKRGKEIDSRAKTIFWMGDMVELTVVELAKLAGCNLVATGLQQMKVELQMNGGSTRVTGHPDGLLICGQQIYLLEVKSMSSYSFAKFQKDKMSIGSYLHQINAYMAALGFVHDCVLVGINKDSGVMHEATYERDDYIVDEIRTNIRTVLKSEPESLPEPPKELDFDKKTRHYPWNCLYCQWHCLCRTNAKKTLIGKAYKLTEPRNEENMQQVPDKKGAAGLS